MSPGAGNDKLFLGGYSHSHDPGHGSRRKKRREGKKGLGVGGFGSERLIGGRFGIEVVLSMTAEERKEVVRTWGRKTWKERRARLHTESRREGPSDWETDLLNRTRPLGRLSEGSF